MKKSVTTTQRGLSGGSSKGHTEVGSVRRRFESQDDILMCDGRGPVS